MSLKVAALYHFVSFDAPEGLRTILLTQLGPTRIKGTILVANEGINGTVAGPGDEIDTFIAFLGALPGLAALDVKFSHALTMPFHRMKVKVKREIVTMGIDGIDPSKEVGTYVPPSQWNALIEDPETILIDTRNDYEVAIGSFEGATDPKTKTFRDFPQWFADNRAHLTAGKAHPKFAMFCTGGIRCEKSTAFLKAQGIDEVFHLQGGILRYLEEIPEDESVWRGECFVFDDRVSVKHGLEIGALELCRACRSPLDDDARASPHFQEGVSCPQCFEARTDEDRARYAQRQLQIELAQKRGQRHIGVDPRQKR